LRARSGSGQVLSQVSQGSSEWQPSLIIPSLFPRRKHICTDLCFRQTEILNKHMSIGFTVPFLNLIGHSVADTSQVGLLVGAFGTLLN
jgi:hypothetical protein